MNDIERAKKILESHGYQVELICEMSKFWKDIKLILNSGATREVILHLLKIYYWGSNEDLRNYWFRETPTKFNTISLVKKSKGKDMYPEADKIFNEIWSAWGDTQSALMRTLNNDPDYKSFPRITNIDDNALNFCKEYIQWMSQKLSEEGTVIESEAYEFLKSLYSKYKAN